MRVAAPLASHTTSVTAFGEARGGAAAQAAHVKPSRTGSSGCAGSPGAAGGAAATCGRLDLVPRYSPLVVAASTRSWVASGVVENAVAPGWRASRHTPNPASNAAPVSRSHGSA